MFNLHIQNFVEQRVEALHKILQKNNRKVLVVGISGGVDSAVVLGLLKQLDLTYPNVYQIRPITAPIRRSQGTTGQDTAKRLGDVIISHFNLEEAARNYNLSDLSSVATSTFSIRTPYVTQQVDYWLRPMAFYRVAAASEFSILVSTTNFAEWSLGWFSQYLDIFGIHPIIDCHKSFVFDLARYFNIPSEIIDAPPSGGLANSNTDEQELGFTYDQFEAYSDSEKLPEEITSKILYRIQSTEFKRFRFNPKFIFQLNSDFYD